MDAKQYALALLELADQPEPPPDAQTVKDWRDAHRPLIERLIDLLATIPRDVQRGGLRLRDLQVRLAGRGKGCIANHAELGDCLRRLGFRRHRAWSPDDDGFRAVWKLEQR